MAITTVDGYVAATKQRAAWIKTSTRSTVATGWFSLFDLAGNPGAGTLNVGNTANGLVPTDATAGYPTLNTFGGGATGYLTKVEYGSSVACRMMICDRLFVAGAYAFNANIALTSQPSYSGRIPGGTDYKGLEIWVETVTAATGNQTWNVTYCVDPSTEALTKRGWLGPDQITKDDEILAFDPLTRTTRWESLRDVFVKRDYKGDMLMLGGQELGAFTTPDHRWPIETATKDGYEAKSKVVTSETLPGSGYILRGALHEAPSIAKYSDAFVRLCAWYFTEGCLHPDGKGVTICQSHKVNAENVAAIRADLIAEGGVFNEGHAPSDGINPGRPRREGLGVRESVGPEMVRWNLRGTWIDRLIECVQEPVKIPSMEFLTSLTDEQLVMFVDTAIRGDGIEERGLFYQHDTQRMDAFMVAAVLAGWGVSVDSKGTGATLREKQGRGRARSQLNKVSRKRLYYEGTVWCPVTHSGHWVARRNGKVFITGNTDQDGNAGATTGAVGIGAAPTVGRCWQLPLAAGDTGVQLIQNVAGGTGTAGTANIMVLRPLWEGRVAVANSGDLHDFLKTGMPQIWDTSALYILIAADSTSSGIPELNIEVANG